MAHSSQIPEPKLHGRTIPEWNRLGCFSMKEIDAYWRLEQEVDNYGQYDFDFDEDRTDIIGVKECQE